MVKDIIQKRRSIYPEQYIAKEIPTSFIQDLLLAANAAPNHKKTQPWRFKVVQGKKLEDLGAFLAQKYKETSGDNFSEFKRKKLQSKATKSSCAIAIFMQPDAKARIPEWEEVAATAMAVQNMWLLCTENNIGCYWSSPGLIKHANAFFDAPTKEKCLGFLYMGYYEGERPESSQKPLENVVEWFS